MDYNGHSSSSSLLLQHLGFVNDEIYKGELELPDDGSFDVSMNERGFISGCDRPLVDRPEDQPHQGRQSSDRLRELDDHENLERPFHVPPWKGTFTFRINTRDNERTDGTGKGHSYEPFSGNGFDGGFGDGVETETYEHRLERIVKELGDLENEDETVESRDPTPALTAGSSMTPVTESPPPTPSDGQLMITSSKNISIPSRDLKGKRCEAPPKQGVIPMKPVSQQSQSGQNTRKRKQDAAVSENGRTNTHNRCARKRTRKTDEAFNVGFLLERFDFLSVHDDGLAWSCPFPHSASIGSMCQNHFDASGLYEHINEHIVAFETTHHGQALECPLKAETGCNWGDKNRKEVKKIGPNETLARHIVDSHHKARRVQCPCGGIVGRGILDQVVRHLKGPGHTAKLEKKRRDDTDFPDYPNIINDRIRLLQEQRLWEQGANARTDSDRQEESSNGRKRARHEL